MEQWWEEIAENVVRNYVEVQRVRRKQGWKAGGGTMRQIARLRRRKTEDLEKNRRRKRQGRVQDSEGEG